MKKSFKNLVKKNLGYKKCLKEKAINFMSNGKSMIIVLIVELIKRSRIKMNQYFPKSFRSFERNINVEFDLSNYAAKSDINISHMLILRVFH